MQLNIFFHPAELGSVETSASDVYIVIDVMRATTTMAVMFEAGAQRVLAAQTLEQAQEAARKVPGRMLCGERHTKTPAGFDYGNLPAQFAQLDLSQKELILTTSNGTRALFACPEGSMRLVGSFYNAQAVARYALEQAIKREGNIAIICAAEYGYFALEDSTCAGYMAQELLRQKSDLGHPDNVQAAITLYESYPPDKLRECAQSARDLKAVGQAHDLDFCLHKNVSNCVPAVSGTETATGLLIVEKVR